MKYSKKSVYRISDNSYSSDEQEKLKLKITDHRKNNRDLKHTVESDKSKRVLSPVEYSQLTHYKQHGKSKKLRAKREINPHSAPAISSKFSIKSCVYSIKKGIKSYLNKVDFIFLFLVILIGFIGILAVHSGSMTDPAHRRIDTLQVFSFVLGISAIFFIPLFDVEEILKKWKLIYFINILILVITLFLGYSPTGEENKSWINLGFTSIQPAEFSKVLFILSLSSHLENVKERLNNLPVLMSVIFHGLSIIGLVLAERDWGNCLVFIFIFLILLFCANINYKYIFTGICSSVILFPLIWDNLGEFRKRRVLIGFDPELDPLGYGHQVIRSRNAIASGGLLGQGYLNGETIQRTGGLFAQHTDMVFAVIGQEFGFIGCITLIFLFAFLIIRIISIGSKAGNYFGGYVCCGVAGMFIFQFIINIGMALGISPVVGITLPLVSYGTSSLISMYFSLALIMLVYSNSKSYSYKSI